MGCSSMRLGERSTNLHGHLALDIERARGFIQHEHPRIRKNSAGKRYPLSLAPAQSCPALADLGGKCTRARHARSRNGGPVLTLARGDADATNCIEVAHGGRGCPYGAAWVTMHRRGATPVRKTTTISPLPSPPLPVHYKTPELKLTPVSKSARMIDLPLKSTAPAFWR